MPIKLSAVFVCDRCERPFDQKVLSSDEVSTAQERATKESSVEVEAVEILGVSKNPLSVKVLVGGKLTHDFEWLCDSCNSTISKLINKFDYGKKDSK